MISVFVGFIAVSLAVVVAAALFGLAMAVIRYCVWKDKRFQERHRECIRERRKNIVYDNYLTRYKSWG